MYVMPTISVRDERGTTLVELLVAISAGVVVLAAISAVAIITMRQTARVSTEVKANQRARLVLSQVIEELHSACVAPQIAPVQTGSTGTSISFLHQTGSAVAPTPILSKVTLSEGTLTQSNYPSTGGSAPHWTFASTPSSTEQLMTKITPTPPSTSIFSYYAYSNGEISPTPLTTPLSESNASLTAQVTVALTAEPPNTPIANPNAPANVTNSALMRFTPASYTSNASNLPCQ
jgi:Tfp pilus assembly protein PilW